MNKKDGRNVTNVVRQAARKANVRPAVFQPAKKPTYVVTRIKGPGVLSAKANPFKYAKIGYNYLSKVAKECGFEIVS